MPVSWRYPHLCTRTSLTIDRSSSKLFGANSPSDLFHVAIRQKDVVGRIWRKNPDTTPCYFDGHRPMMVSSPSPWISSPGQDDRWIEFKARFVRPTFLEKLTLRLWACHRMYMFLGLPPTTMYSCRHLNSTLPSILPRDGGFDPISFFCSMGLLIVGYFAMLINWWLFQVDGLYFCRPKRLRSTL
jgi:hypothetical protein